MAKNFVRTTKIENSTVFLTMIFAGITAILYGIYLLKYDVQPYFISVAGFFIVLIGFSELGIKRFSKLSKLKNLNTQQYLSLGTYIVVLLDSILRLPQVSMTIPIISDFSGGTFIIGGLFIIIEAVR